MKLIDLTHQMQDFNRRAAPGSECAAWQAYHADCQQTYGCGPAADAAWDIEPSPEFVAYWTKVIEGESVDYDGDSGDAR